jgi:protein ImuB
MLWLALHFPLLSLEIFTRGTGESRPLAVASAPDNRPQIIAANRCARKSGIVSGIEVSAAYALNAQLHVIPRDIEKEQATLKRIAAWALQFTSLASIDEPSEVLLEIEGSLKLFGGLAPLYRRIQQGIAQLGFDAVMACAPTPLAAQLFARAGLSVRIQHRDALRHALERLPVALLADEAAMLERFGVRTFGECLQLPRDGLARRAGQDLLDKLDRALGAQPDPRKPFVPPQTYAATLPLPAPVEYAEALLFGARRLLAELCGLLSAGGNGVQYLDFEFAHDKRDPTRAAVELVGASRDAEHLLNVLRERLARVLLPAPATEIGLNAGRFTPLAARNLSFLPDSRNEADTASRFMERLSARLGSDAIRGLMPWPDYRPEHAWRACKPGESGTIAPNALPTRPLWLLATPKPLQEIDSVPQQDGPLSLLIGPERIEAGWWDGQSVVRDYFVACDPVQSLLWIYRERSAAARWYIHGFFS